MIKFHLNPRQNPITKASKFYAFIETSDEINIDTLAERISATCTVTPADIYGVLESLEEQMMQLLQDGRSVRFGKIGSFRITLLSIPSNDPLQVNANSIRCLRVRFSPSPSLRQALSLTNPDIRFYQTDKKKKTSAPSEPETV